MAEAPQLLAQVGPHRVPLYSSGRRSSRRLKRGGDRQANAALHRIGLPTTRAARFRALRHGSADLFGCAGELRCAVNDSVDLNSLRKLVEGRLLRLEGNAVQDCMDRFGLEVYPGDYQPVRAAGPKGDTKSDGY